MDCIKLLPDNIANQIAAGEVVQRPASVVKELLENALDAGATDIKLIVKEGGTLLIQIIDNGSGMGVTDARMCWERHATSKIREAGDLFRIRSFGFRGEALASIAAIAQVEMKTKRAEDELGTLIRIEGSRISEQNPVACLNGTQFSIRNLFYNVPARRNFLKSVQVELRHIIDEFTRVAMPHNDVAFTLLHNDKDVFDLKPSTPARRIAELLNRKHEKDFLSVEESHDLLSVSGFVGKPEIAKRTRGEQFLFVNKRFIKDPYLHHAVVNAFDQMIAKDQYPLYVLFLEIDPKSIDVNIHPTKTEIKFEDERAIYSLVKAAVRKALGHYVTIPEIDFADPNVFNPVGFQKPEHSTHINAPGFKVDRSFNPFADTGYKPVQSRNWQELFGNPYIERSQAQLINKETEQDPAEQEAHGIDEVFQIGDGYLAARRKGKLLVIDQRAAHERILFEKHLRNVSQHKAVVQQLLFPRSIELSGPDYVLAHEILDEIKDIGFDVADFGTNCLIINGVPSGTDKGNEKELLEGMIEYYKNNASEFKENKSKALATAMARNESILKSRSMNTLEMKDLIDKLFSCENPGSRPNGKPVYIELNTEILQNYFR